jgi:hypothetical protein
MVGSFCAICVSYPHGIENAVLSSVQLRGLFSGPTSNSILQISDGDCERLELARQQKALPDGNTAAVYDLIRDSEASQVLPKIKKQRHLHA